MRRLIITFSLFFVFEISSIGMFMAPSPIPLERIVKNTEAHLAENPKDARAYYTIARAYYLSFYNQSLTVPGFDSGRPGARSSVAPHWMAADFKYILLRNEAQKRVLEEFQLDSLAELDSKVRNNFYKRLSVVTNELKKSKWKPKKLSANEVLVFAEKSKNYFLKAIQISKDEGLYYLGLASLYQQVNDFLEVNKLESDAFKNIDEKIIKSLFWKAFLISKSKDQKRQFRPPEGLPGLVSYEAGKTLLKDDTLVESRIKTISDHLKKMEKLKVGPITPLVITDNDKIKPNQFARTNQFVRFDLNGDGYSESCSWISPETGILVWDPMNSKSIRSGRQLFGNYTFQLIWKDGFDAIASLDNNADRCLSGNELDGISVWFDQNSNGQSDPREVKPLSQHGINSLKFDKVTTMGGMKVHVDGVSFESGKTGNLWDWISIPQ